MTQPIVLIPVNRLDRAKGRLATVLTQAQREQLALATLRTVWRAAREAVPHVTILTADPRVAAALGPGAEVIPESPALHGLNAQLTHAAEALLRDNPGVPLLILHADLPLATAQAIGGFIAATLPAPSVTIVRSGDGGTNAMLQTNPGRLTLAYGPDSAAKHQANAHAAGLSFAIHHAPELELDLDTPADLIALLATAAGPGTLAGKALAEMNMAATPGATP